MAAGPHPRLGERVHQPGPDLLLAVAERDPAAYSPDFEDGLALQRILEAIIDSDAAGGSPVRL